jgi:hypothetical protein
LWFYRRGLARLALNRPLDASTDLNTALRSTPEAWIRGRIELALGKVADVTGRRTDARDFYRRAAETARAANDPVALAEASRLLNQPFVLSRAFTDLRDMPAWHTASRHNPAPVTV